MTASERDDWQDSSSSWLGLGVAVITVMIAVAAMVLL